MGVNVSTKAVHSINGISRLKFPRSSLERVGQIVESTDWAQVNDVSRQFVSHHTFNISRDLIDLASSDLTKSKLTSDLFGESDASSAVDAPGHASLDEWSDVLILDGPLVFSEATLLVSINSRDVLQIALAALIANGAVKWMVS